MGNRASALRPASRPRLAMVAPLTTVVVGGLLVGLTASRRAAASTLLRPPSTGTLAVARRHGLSLGRRWLRSTAAVTQSVSRHAAADDVVAANKSTAVIRKSSWLRLAGYGMMVMASVQWWASRRPLPHRLPAPHRRWHAGAAAAQQLGRTPLLSPGGPYGAELRVALEAVVAASHAARRVAPTPGNEMTKADRSPVTVADFAVQAIILRSLHEAFPEDPICAEEAASALRTDRPLLDRVVAAVQSVIPTATPEDVCQWIDYGTYRGNGSRYWTLDPVDGTKGFLRGEQYAVCLALLVDGAPVLGVQGCPNLPAQPGSYTDTQHDGTLGALFYAVRGHGAYAEPMPAPATAAYGADKRPPIHLQPPPTFSMAAEEVRFCESVEAGHSSHDDAARVAMELGIVRPSLRMDSQAKYCAMARGDAQILLRLPGGLTGGDYRENTWDQASGTLILEEAGGAVCDQYGRPLDFTTGAKLDNNKGVIAAVHRDLLARVLAAVGRVLEAPPAKG